jgi:hypothetical protein
MARAAGRTSSLAHGHCGQPESVGLLRKHSRFGRSQHGKRAMWLIVVYLGLMITGDVLAYFIGLFVERNWPAASLPFFLAMYFLFLWFSWLIAVKLTEPKTQTS